MPTVHNNPAAVPVIMLKDFRTRENAEVRHFRWCSSCVSGGNAESILVPANQFLSIWCRDVRSPRIERCNISKGENARRRQSVDCIYADTVHKEALAGIRCQQGQVRITVLDRLTW